MSLAPLLNSTSTFQPPPVPFTPGPDPVQTSQGELSAGWGGYDGTPDDVDMWIRDLETSTARNLCDIPGHVLCRGSLGIPRNAPWYLDWIGLGSKMPQTPDSNADLVGLLQKNNYRGSWIPDTQVSLKNMVPIQGEMNPKKVAALLKHLRDTKGGPFFSQIRIAKYPGHKKVYVLDGHHRFAALYLYHKEQNRGLNKKIPVFQITMDAKRHKSPYDFINEFNTFEGVTHHNLTRISSGVDSGGYVFGKGVH